MPVLVLLIIPDLGKVKYIKYNKNPLSLPRLSYSALNDTLFRNQMSSIKGLVFSCWQFFVVAIALPAKEKIIIYYYFFFIYSTNHFMLVIFNSLFSRASYFVEILPSLNSSTEAFERTIHE